MKTLRDYQHKAIECVNAEFRRGTQSTMIILPTGTGKTVLFSRLASEWPSGNVLILAHRIELLDQAADKLQSELGYRPPIEQGMRSLDAETSWSAGNVVIGSVQSMRKRVAKYKQRPFGLVIVDECHHAVAASYTSIIEECLSVNPQCRILGVTATPKRADKIATGLAFQSLAYSMEMHEAIELGWLVDIKQEVVQIQDIDLSGIGSSRNELGEADFDRVALEAILTEEKPLHTLATPILDHSKNGEQAVVFTAGVKHAHMLADVLNRYKPGSAAAVDGKTDKTERANLIEAFHRGNLQYLCNFGVFTEGFDCPAASRIVMGRPTKSASLYIQMLGRGTRPLPGVIDGLDDPEDRKDAISGSNKPHMIVLDFVGNSRHKAVTAVDALGGNYDVETRELARKNVTRKGGDVMQELKKARAEIALLREEKMRQRVKAKVTYTTSSVPVFEHAAVPTVSNGIVRGGATDGQINLLVNLGVKRETAASWGKGQAGKVIDSLTATRCTDKQRSILTKFGYDPNVPFAEARQIIDGIAANGWKRA